MSCKCGVGKQGHAILGYLCSNKVSLCQSNFVEIIGLFRRLGKIW